MADDAVQQNMTETDTDSLAGLDDIMAALTPPATERPRDETGKFVARQESEAEPEAEQAEGEAEEVAPAEEPTSDEAEQEPEPEALPTIEPPRFWNAQERAVWDSLTPQAREVILAKETERDATTSRERNEAAEARKRFESEAQTTAQERQRYVEFLQGGPRLLAMMDPILAEGSQTDWAKLAQEDPAEYVAKKAAYEQRLGLVNAVQAEIQRVTETQANEAKANHAKRLAEVFPDFADSVKGRALKDTYVPTLKEAGFSAEEIEQGWGMTLDPRYYLVLDKAAKYDKVMAARTTLAAKKTQPKPTTVQKPRAADTSPKVNPKLAALEKRAKTTGRMSDEADYLLAALMEGSPR